MKKTAGVFGLLTNDGWMGTLSGGVGTRRRDGLASTRQSVFSFVSRLRPTAAHSEGPNSVRNSDSSVLVSPAITRCFQGVQSERFFGGVLQMCPRSAEQHVDLITRRQHVPRAIKDHALLAGGGAHPALDANGIFEVLGRERNDCDREDYVKSTANKKSCTTSPTG